MTAVDWWDREPPSDWDQPVSWTQPQDVPPRPGGDLEPYSGEFHRDPLLAAAVADVLRGRRARQIATEVEDRRRGQEWPDAGTLSELLARPQLDAWRVKGLLPAGGRLLWTAQRKTGKTTAVNNLARALLKGEEFLGLFETEKVDGRVIVLNYEVTGQQFSTWANDVGVPRDGMYVVNLRGRRNLLADEEGRDYLVHLIRQQEGAVLVVDPFGRAYTGKSQNDSAEVTPWLVRLDEVAERAGISEVILTAHAGWNGERTRGSSALEDWPDVIVTMTRDEETDERFLKAEGRDVDLEEDRLIYHAQTRRLYLTGDGSRASIKAANRIADLAEALPPVVEAEPGANVERLRELLRASGASFQRNDVGKAARHAEKQGWIRIEAGPRGARLHFPPESTTHTDPYRPVPGTAATRTDPYLGTGTGGGTSEADAAPIQDELDGAA